MNYRHLYHAGNFADVLKHTVLILLLESLQRKPAPFCFLDTHAGIGIYPLQSEQAQKKREYHQGVSQILNNEKSITDHSIMHYSQIVKRYNTDTELSIYPGSPEIAAQVLRSQDQMIFCELHPDDYQTLKKNLSKKANVAIHHNNGYLGIKAFLPPKEKRGLVLIDPPFEETDEFDQIVMSMQHIKKHWQSGHVMIWYPIKDKKAVSRFYKKLSALALPQLCIEFTLNKTEIGKGLNSCGVLLVNPPWMTEETLKTTLLPQLAKTLDAKWVFTTNHS